MSKAILAKTDGSMEIVDFDESNSYDIIKEAIGGGTFACVTIRHEDTGTVFDMWIDDDGKLVENPQVNQLGTILWMSNYGMTDVIMGDIIITRGPDSEGRTLGLTDSDIEMIGMIITGEYESMQEVLEDKEEV